MVDLDIGTENMRWMGDTRFVLGFVRGIVSPRNHQCRIRMKVVVDDKVEMARAAREWAAQVKGKKAIGGGKDPLAEGGIVKMNVGPPPAGTPAQADQDDKKRDKVHDEVVKANGDADDAAEALPPAKPLVPDDSWTTIQTGPAASITQAQRDAQAASTGRSGGWIDGEGILYL